MLITDIKTYPFTINTRGFCLVKVETDEGIFGWGESALNSRELAVCGAIEHFKTLLIGRDPMQRDALWQLMLRGQYYEAGRVFMSAISAIDIALHDITGKALGVPVYQLLGGKQRESIPCFASTFAKMDETLIEEAKLLIDNGWNSIRTASHLHNAPDNTYNPNDAVGPTALWLNKLREAVGEDVTIGIDWHSRLDIGQTVRFANKLNPGTLDYIEEPLRSQSPEAYRQLRDNINIPLAVGEELTNKWDYAPYINHGLTEFIRFDLANCGGFTEAMKITAMAEARYLPLMPHNPLSPVGHSATMHLCAAATCFAWLEMRLSPVEPPSFDADEIFPVRQTAGLPLCPISDTPGLGVEVNEEWLKAHAFKPWHPPILHHPDGSLTNW